MTTTDKKINRLQIISRRLKIIAKINMGLMLVLFACCVICYLLILRLSSDIERDDWNQLYSFQALLRNMMRLNLACLGLLLVWGPALVVCSFKIKKLKKA